MCYEKAVNVIQGFNPEKSKEKTCSRVGDWKYDFVFIDFLREGEKVSRKLLEADTSGRLEGGVMHELLTENKGREEGRRRCFDWLTKSR